jgi:hypothetical protein
MGIRDNSWNRKPGESLENCMGRPNDSIGRICNQKSTGGEGDGRGQGTNGQLREITVPVRLDRAFALTLPV